MKYGLTAAAIKNLVTARTEVLYQDLVLTCHDADRYLWWRRLPVNL